MKLTLTSDLYGRGYSAAPDPTVYRYDSSLYIAQVLLCLQSATLKWRHFTLIGYSLGGAIAADFASYLPNMLDGLILIAPGGLIRTNHITWKSRFLYSTSEFLPEWLIERLVAGRLWTGAQAARTIEPESDNAAGVEGELKGGLRGQAVYTSSHFCLLPGNPNSTVGKVVDWQIKNHKGFVPAFISSIRYAPIHAQQDRWRLIKDHISRARSDPSDTSARLKGVHVILGKTDPIIVADEFIEDVNEVLGPDFVRVMVIEGVGHDVAIERANDIGDVISGILQPPSRSAKAAPKKSSSIFSMKSSQKKPKSEAKQASTTNHETESMKAPSTHQKTKSEGKQPDHDKLETESTKAPSTHKTTKSEGRQVDITDLEAELKKASSKHKKSKSDAASTKAPSTHSKSSSLFKRKKSEKKEKKEKKDK